MAQRDAQRLLRFGCLKQAADAQKHASLCEVKLAQKRVQVFELNVARDLVSPAPEPILTAEERQTADTIVSHAFQAA